MSDTPLSPEVRDQLARQLQENLKRQRPRTRRWLLLAVPFVAAALVGLWKGVQPARELPPLMLLVFDALESDAVVEAQLVAPGNPETNREGLDVHWKMQDLRHDETATTKTDRQGIARYRIGSGDDKLRGRERRAVRILDPQVQVSFIDPAGAYRRDKSVALTVLEKFGDTILVVPVENLIGQRDGIDWATAELPKLPRPPSRSSLGLEACMSTGSGEQCWVIFAGGEMDGIAYQRMREWLQGHQGKADDDAPLGPLLREPADVVERRLGERFGPEKIRLWQPPRGGKLPSLPAEK